MNQRIAIPVFFWSGVSLLALAGCGGDGDPPVAAAPTIATQPAGLSVTQGQAAAFTVAATGTELSYQWRRAGADVAGANAAAYSIAAAALADSGAAFNVRVCTGPQANNDCVVSSEATLTVNPVVIVLNATQLAGTPGAVGSADGSGAAARFNTANYLAVNATGTLYVGDFNNHTIRAITPAGAVSTLAGSPGVAGYADGSGAAARFRGNGGLAVNSAGDIFVADWDNFVVRRITPAGVVSTFAGMAGASGSLDGTGAAARMSNPNGLAIDAAGNLFLADWGNHTVRRITPAGVVTTLAGTPGAPGSADGTGAAARFNQPNGVAVDGAGNVYVSDTNNHTIRRITPAGVVSTLAGQAGAASHTDGSGSAARLNQPAWLSLSPSGDLFFTSGAGNTVRKLTPAGVVTTVVGVVDGGPNPAVVLGANPRLRNARGVLALSSNQLVVVADNAVLNVTVP